MDSTITHDVSAVAAYSEQVGRRDAGQVDCYDETGAERVEQHDAGTGDEDVNGALAATYQRMVQRKERVVPVYAGSLFSLFHALS